MDLRQEVQKHARRYKRYRDNNQLIQGEWRTDEGEERGANGKFGPVYACALGAFLKAEHDRHAVRVGCAAHMMPDWLVEATPDFFDHIYTNEPGFHLKWADALYMPGGIVARASKLAETQRKKLYDAAEKEIRRRYGCQYVAAGNEAEDWYNYRADPFQDFIRAHFMTPEEAAGTIINVLDELLTEAGA